jgi:hypothetical protein
MGDVCSDADYPVRATAQGGLRKLKVMCSSQSKKNFLLERDLRYLDSRIALLIQNVRPLPPRVRSVH